MTVSAALTEEIGRLSLLVNDFEKPFSSDQLVLSVYKKELHTHVERGLGSNVRARLNTAFTNLKQCEKTGNSKGYAFLNFASFEASDAGIEAVNEQYLCIRAITISYAFEIRHGSTTELLLADQNPLAQADRHHQLFTDAPAAALVSQ